VTVDAVWAAETLPAFIAITRDAVNDALERWLPVPPACPAVLSEAMRYSLFAGGKRLRPILAVASAHAVACADAGATAISGAPPSAANPIALALPAACAVELIHTYSLIHDDLPAMDDDTMRRGRPTAHVEHGEGMAILAGDGLQTLAFALMAREPGGPLGQHPEICRRRLHGIGVLADAAGPAGMVAGQALDLQAAGQSRTARIVLDAEGLQAMHARKTGALVRAAAVSGAIMAGAQPSTIAAIEGFGADIGLAFQIVDDILDVEGEAGSLGKTIGKDASHDKPTYPSLFGIERSRALAHECLQRARQALADARLTRGWLDGIARWVVERNT
jgi:geranylgeranyl pyrophosphate synthase